MKNLLVLSFVAFAFAACSTQRDASQPLSGLGVNNGAGIAKHLKVEIRKGLVVKGESASVKALTGVELAGAACTASSAVDFVKLQCVSDAMNLDLGRIVTAPAPRGTLSINDLNYTVVCTKAPASGPNGVDGPVLEFSCDATVAPQAE